MVSAHDVDDGRGSVAVPPIVDQQSWEAALAELRSREKAATRELDARFVIVTQGPLDEALAYKARVAKRWRGTPR